MPTALTHARHENLIVLWAEPNSNNPPQHIGYVCPGCLSLYTANHRPSDPTVTTKPNAPMDCRRRNLAHARRIRAAERLGLVVRVPLRDSLGAVL